MISNVDPAGSFNTWAHVAFDESRWSEMVNNLESTQAAWDDSDWKENEAEENSNKPEDNSNWNKSPPSSPPPSRSSNSHSTPPPFNLFNNESAFDLKSAVDKLFLQKLYFIALFKIKS